jgi:O-antigen/teichoic acid export membrane protein
MLKKVLKNSLLYGIAPQIAAIANIIVLPLITPNLTKIDFGINGIALSYIGVLTLIQSLGLKIVYANSFFYYPKQYKWIWRQLLGFELICNFIFQVFFAIIIYITLPEQVGGNRFFLTILIILPQVILTPFSNVSALRYQLEERPFPIVIRSVIFGVLNVVLTYYFIVIEKQGYLGWFISMAFTSVLLNLTYIYPTFVKFKLFPIFNFKWRLIKKSLKVSLPAIPHYYSIYLLDSSDRIVMERLNVNTESIGEYSLAYAVSGKFSVLGDALGGAIGPTLSKLLKENKFKELRDLTFLLQFIFIVLGFLASIWLNEVFSILIKGQNISELIPMAIVILMSYTYRPLYMAASSQLMYFEKTKSLWKISFGAGILNVILNLILIPFLGYKVAVITTLLSYLYMGLLGYFTNEFKKGNKYNYYPLRWGLAILACTFFAYKIYNIDVFYKVFLTIIIVLSGFIFLKKKAPFF